MDPGLNRKFYLPRLPREYYCGDAVVHWTLPVADRQTGWLNQEFHAAFRELVIHAVVREKLICPAYCLMPDHLHLIWMGLSLESDQLNGMAFLRTYLEPRLHPARFEHQAHDHVLKEREREKGAFQAICDYIFENPVRAGFVKTAREWAYSGAVVAGYPKLQPFDPDYWMTFGKIHAVLKKPDAGQIQRPPLSG